MLSRNVALIAIVAWTGCILPERPSPVQPHPSLRDQPLAEREAQYQQYRLSGSSMITRADGAHSYSDLRDSFGQYPRSRALYMRVANRDASLANCLIWGVAIAATGGVDQLAALDNSDKMTQTGRNVFYGIGGALIVTAAIAALTWHNPMNELVRTYNQELRADLALPDAPSQVGTATALRF